MVVIFDKSIVFIKDRRTHKDLLVGVKSGLYQVALEENKVSFQTWNVNERKLNQIVNIFNLPVSNNFFNKFKSCLIGKCMLFLTTLDLNNPPLKLKNCSLWIYQGPPQ